MVQSLLEVAWRPVSDLVKVFSDTKIKQKGTESIKSVMNLTKSQLWKELHTWLLDILMEDIASIIMGATMKLSIAPHMISVTPVVSHKPSECWLNINRCCVSSVFECWAVNPMHDFSVWIVKIDGSKVEKKSMRVKERWKNEFGGSISKLSGQ